MALPITLQVSTTLDVVDKQKKLVEEALGPDGVYIRLKETLLEFVDQGEGVKDYDRTKLVSETLASTVGAITNNAMSAGLQWAAQEKELALQKERLEYELALLDKQIDTQENQAEDNLASRQLKQAQRIRDYGIAVLDSEGNVVTLNDGGRLYAQEQNTEQDTKNKVKLESQIASQTDEVQARTHRTVADTYVNHGIFTWTDISETGISGVNKTATGYVTLSDLNKEVAAEQAKGYTYNAWSNAATSSSGMIGTLVAAEIPGLDPTTYLNTWQTSVDNLKNLTPPAISV